MVGTGYVGLVTGACFAEVGNEVLCLDLDQAKIRTLEAGGIPIYEPGLAEVVKRNVAAGRLSFTTDVARAVGFGTVQCIAVGTPPGEDGSADLKHVTAAARNIGRHMGEYRVVTSNTLVGLPTRCARRSPRSSRRGVEIPFAVVSNPGSRKAPRSAISCGPTAWWWDPMTPRRRRPCARATRPSSAIHEHTLVMDVRGSSQVRGERAMLARRASFMNEIANLAERLGADIEGCAGHRVVDPRIGCQFLRAGIG
jgi:UDPglucose 6-dehydrogenase